MASHFFANSNEKTLFDKFKEIFEKMKWIIALCRFKGLAVTIEI